MFLIVYVAFELFNVKVSILSLILSVIFPVASLKVVIVKITSSSTLKTPISKAVVELYFKTLD